MRKKIFAAFVIAVGFAGYNVIQSHNDKNALSDLLMANVEALAEGGEASSTWKCNGWWGSCKAYCGICGSSIEGDGNQEGSHSCSKN